MNKHRVESVIAAAILAAFGWSAFAADTSGTPAKTEYWLMDHSPADAKAMRLMSKPGSQTPQTSTVAGKVEYHTMDHSPADVKAMQRMSKDKSEAKKQQGKTEYSLMDHSRADVKAMRGMKGPEKVVTVGE